MLKKLKNINKVWICNKDDKLVLSEVKNPEVDQDGNLYTTNLYTATLPKRFWGETLDQLKARMIVHETKMYLAGIKAVENKYSRAKKEKDEG